MMFSPMPTSLEEAKREILSWREMHRQQVAEVKQLRQDAKRLDWLAIHGSFGVDSVTGLPGGNGQKRIAATRQAIDSAMQGGQK